MDVSENSGTPKSSPSILGYPYFWKHPNGVIVISHGLVESAKKSPPPQQPTTPACRMSIKIQVSTLSQTQKKTGEKKKQSIYRIFTYIYHKNQS